MWLSMQNTIISTKAWLSTVKQVAGNKNDSNRWKGDEEMGPCHVTKAETVEWRKADRMLNVLTFVANL